MKYSFNNVGVAQVQAQILALPAGERAAELHKMRTDFIAWMDSHFELSSSEQEDLTSLPESFREEIGHQSANVLEQGGTFSFFKRDHPSTAQSREPRGKDILLQSVQRQRYSFDEGTLTNVSDLSIDIS